MSNMAKSTQKGLGKGLGALFSESPALDEIETSGGQNTLPVQSLEPNPYQPRQAFDEEALAELADSIRQHGLIQPITVRPTADGYYQIIAGERRWRASRLAGLKEVPVAILQVDEQKAAQMALIENLQREDLNPVEEAQGYAALIQNYGLTQEQVADTIGKSRTAVTNTLRLLKLSQGVLDRLKAGELSAGHARALLPLEDEAAMEAAAEQIIARQLSVRQTEALVKRLLHTPKAEPQKERDLLAVDYVRECELALTKHLGRRVTIKTGKGRGKFELEYYGEEDLQKLIEALESIKI